MDICFVVVQRWIFVQNNYNQRYYLLQCLTRRRVINVALSDITQRTLTLNKRFQRDKLTIHTCCHYVKLVVNDTGSSIVYTVEGDPLLKSYVAINGRSRSIYF